MKLKKATLPLLVLVLLTLIVLTPRLPSVIAYFTANTRAKGGFTIHQSATTSIDESFNNWTKHIAITNQEGVPVFVRARAYSAFKVQYSGTGWKSNEDGWYYYQSAVEEGKTTGTLNVKIEERPTPEEETNFNVAVVYESTPVQYEADGTAFADWSMILDTREEVQP